MKTFEELHCWKKSAALIKKLSLLVRTFPGDEGFRLIDQILRASRYLLKARNVNPIDEPQIAYGLSEADDRITDNG